MDKMRKVGYVGAYLQTITWVGEAEDQEFHASLGIKVKMKQACPLYMKPCLRVGYELAWGGF